MFRRAALAVVLTLMAQASVRAQHLLSEDALDNRCFHIQLSLELKGKAKVRQEGKELVFPQTAVATHSFDERILDAKDGLAVKTARYYRKAEATITFDADVSKRALKPDLLVAHRHKDQTVVYHPGKPLTQEEMELMEHFDTLHLAGLLPGKAVAVGDAWKVPSQVAQALCDFDGLVDHDLTGKLTAVKDGVAQLSIVGKARGIDMGTEVNLLVQATGEFDLKQKRLTRLTWKQSDQREQGPVSPAMTADVSIELTRTPVEEPKELNNFALVRIPGGLPPEELTVIHHKDAKSRFSFKYARDWHLVGQQDNQLVLRLLDRGDFVAQATLTPWKKVAADDLPTLAQFEQLMAQSPGWEEEKHIEKTEKVDVPGLRVFRVSAEGKLDGIKAVQFFYLLASNKGEQMIVTFTMTPGHVSKLDARDLTLLRSIRLQSMMMEEKTARGE